MAQSLVIPLAIPLCQFLLSLESLLLTWNPSFCVVRSHPPWSQVACKLNSPSPTLPIPNSHPPQGFPKLIVRPTKTTSQSRLHIVQNKYIFSLTALIFFTITITVLKRTIAYLGRKKSLSVVAKGWECCWSGCTRVGIRRSLFTPGAHLGHSLRHA